MNSNDFSVLNYTEKTELILRGTFLADRLTAQHYIRLYNFDRFYIEVFFDESTRLLTHFRAFEHTLFVLPYLEELKIAV